MAQNLNVYLKAVSNIVSSLENSLVKLQSNEEKEAINEIKDKTQELKKIMNSLEQNKEMSEEPLLKQISKTVSFLESSLSRF